MQVNAGEQKVTSQRQFPVIGKAAFSEFVPVKKEVRYIRKRVQHKSCIMGQKCK